MNYIKAFESHLREEGKAEKNIHVDTVGFLSYLESFSHSENFESTRN